MARNEAVNNSELTLACREGMIMAAIDPGMLLAPGLIRSAFTLQTQPGIYAPAHCVPFGPFAVTITGDIFFFVWLKTFAMSSRAHSAWRRGLENVSIYNCKNSV